MNCAACGATMRKSKLALVAKEGGDVARGRVCGSCFAKAIILVPCVTRVTKGVAPSEAARRESKDVVASAVKKLRGMASGYEAAAKRASNGQGEHISGRAIGLEQAADILDAGDF